MTPAQHKVLIKFMTTRPVCQAIVTRYRAVTDRRKARVIASCAGGRLAVPWDSNLSDDENHAAAMIALCERMEWRPTNWYMGGLNRRGDRVFVSR